MNHSKKITAVLLALIMFFALSPSAFAQDRQALEKKINSLMKKLRDKERQFLQPSEEDLAAFAGFLRQPDTGLARLMPREKYEGKLITRGGGAYFSFTRLEHEYGSGSDISLEQNRLSVGFAGANFGFMARLGNVTLESVTTEHAGVKYLAEFASPSKEPEAREQQRRGWRPGFDVDGFNYAREVEPSVNTTYVLRSVDYGNSDVLVAFRIVRQENDGSLILLWKILNRFPVPRLER